jgi:hypothetical protein
MGGVSATRRLLYRSKWPGTHCIGGWVCLRAGLDGCDKSRPYRDSIPRTLKSVASRFLLRHTDILQVWLRKTRKFSDQNSKQGYPRVRTVHPRGYRNSTFDRDTRVATISVTTDPRVIQHTAGYTVTCVIGAALGNTQFASLVYPLAWGTPATHTRNKMTVQTRRNIVCVFVCLFVCVLIAFHPLYVRRYRSGDECPAKNVTSTYSS